ncbi:MAG: response regulator [Bdellovibrionota bacterium]
MIKDFTPEVEKMTAQLKFLSEISTAISESLDTNSILKAVSSITNQFYSDWFVVDLFASNDLSVERVIMATTDKLNNKFIKPCSEKWQINTDAKEGVSFVVRTGSLKLYASVDAGTMSLLNTPVIEDLPTNNVTSAMIVPLKYYGKIFGALSFYSTQRDRHYSALDVDMALELAKRTSFALENARLFTKANEASRSKSAFLTNISHEVRTPLTAILGFAELLSEEGSVSERGAKYIETIRRNGNQLLRIVNEILDLSKLETDTLEFVKANFSLPQLIDSICVLLAIRAEERNLDFTVTMNTAVDEHIKTDSFRLRQIIMNLISNAIKFTHQGAVHIDVTTKEYLPRKHRLEIKIKDTGIGMDAKQIKELFLPFAQADSEMTRKYGGTGLGLFLARRMSILLGGNVELLRSEPGQGSEFLISVEIGYDEIPQNKVVRTFEYAKSTSDVKNHSMPNKKDGQVPAKVKLLIVDDSADNRELMTHLLSSLGMETQTAENGRQAIEKALSQDFDVILMDIQMPEMDGFEAAKILREKNCHSRIIAVTAHAMKGDRETCLKNGFDDYLSKPLTKESLSQVTVKHLS